VDDLVEGIYRLSQKEYFDPVNIGNPGEHSILDFAERIIRLTGSRSKIRYLPLPEDDPKVRRPDISRAGDILGWKPAVSLEEGLERTIRYFKTELGLA
jgi:nucleoside-diphosphate-sugar epimerase